MADQDLLEKLDHLVNLVLVDRKDPWEVLGRQDQEVNLAVLVSKDLLDPRAIQVNLEKEGHKVPKDQLD